MSNFDFTKPEETALNPIQPVSDDFSTDGYLPEFARVDHQHPLSESLRSAIFNAGNGTFVKKVGDTMSGDLNFNSGVSIKFDGTFNNRMYYVAIPSGVPWMTGPRIVGTDGFSVFTNTQATDVMGYRGAPAGLGHYFWVTNKVLLGKSPSDADAVQAVNINGWIGFLGSTGLSWNGQSGVQVFAQDTSWVRAQPNLYSSGVLAAGTYMVAGGSTQTQGGMVFNCWGPMRSTGSMTCDSTLSASQCIGNANAATYSTAAIWANPGAGNATLSMHPGGIAIVIRAVNGQGNNMFIRGYDGAALCSSWCQGWGVESSRKLKKNITPWPLVSAGAAVQRATDVLTKLEPVTFQFDTRDDEVPPTRRGKALDRLNALRAKKGQDKWQIPEHDCGIHECNGTADDPCVRYTQHRKPRFGLIAEDVAEVFPEAVGLYDNKEVLGIEYHQLTVIAIAAIKELVERINILEGAA